MKTLNNYEKFFLISALTLLVTSLTANYNLNTQKPIKIKEIKLTKQDTINLKEEEKFMSQEAIDQYYKLFGHKNVLESVKKLEQANKS